MMMKMLQAGGLPVLTDGIRAADASNPKGYYELEAVKNTAADPSWLAGAGGKVVKMVSMLLYDLPMDREYRIVFMRRDLDEVLMSQEAMLKRLGQPPGPARDVMKQHYIVHLAKLERWLAQRGNVKTLYVSYNEIMANPAQHATRVREFLGLDLNHAAMAAAVDSGLYRERSGAGSS